MSVVQVKAYKLTPKLNAHIPLGGFPGSSVVKNLTVNARDEGDGEFDPWVEKIPGRRSEQPSCVLPEKSHWQRRLAGCSPWSHTAEGAHTQL